MRIGVLAVQGAFAEHEEKLRQLDVDFFEIRKKEDLKESMDGLVLPGGESTAMIKILNDLDMTDTLKTLIADGMPVLATCAGTILLAEHISNQDCAPGFKTMPMEVYRNAYGRQLGSFTAEAEVKHIGTMMLRFIRAPYIKTVGDKTEVLATVDGNIVAAQYKNQIALTFHPELTEDLRLHRYFVDCVKRAASPHFEQHTA